MVHPTSHLPFIKHDLINHSHVEQVKYEDIIMNTSLCLAAIEHVWVFLATEED